MKNILLFLVLLLPLSGCDCSTEPSLEERFSCKVDGKLFVVAEDSKALFGSRNLTINYYGSKGFAPYYLVFIATNSNDDDISIGCDSVIRGATSYAVTSASYSDKLNRFDKNPIGKVTISKLDTISKKIIGTFFFTTKIEGGSKVIKITEGKFNSSYIQRE